MFIIPRIKTPVKFQRNRHKTVEGVAYTMCLLLEGGERTDGRTGGSFRDNFFRSVMCYVITARLAQSVEHETLNLGSWVRAPRWAYRFLIAFRTTMRVLSTELPISFHFNLPLIPDIVIYLNGICFPL